MENIDIDKIVVSNKVSFGRKGFKYFNGHKDAKKIRHIEKTLMKLHVFLF